MNKNRIIYMGKYISKFCINYPKRGFTLLELLISIAIGAIIAIGVGSVYYAVRGTQNSQNSISELRDNIFMALERMETSLKHANFTEYGEQKISPGASYLELSSPITTTIGTDTTIHTLNTTTANNSDTLTLEMSSPDITNEMIDCSGASMPINTDTLKYSVYQKFTVSNDELFCSKNTRTRNLTMGTDSYTGFLAPVQIALGVKNMQIFYAEKNSTDGCGVSASSNAWKTAAEVIDFTKVCAVNIALLATSQTGQNVNISKEPSANKSFDLRLNDIINDDIAKNIKITTTNSLLKNTRIINKIVFLRNNDKY